MKKTMLFISLFLGLITYANAEDRPIADKETINELKSYCSELASEDNVKEPDLPDFLLKCINEELDGYGYQPIKNL